MQKKVALLCFSILAGLGLYAQKYESITVKAGHSPREYFPYASRYLYPGFTQGKVILKNGNSNTANLNYDLLLGEISFLHGKDTLIIVKKNDLDRVIIEQDTFLYRSDYYKAVHSGRLKVYSKDKIKLIEIVKQGAMGTANRTAAGESYSYIPLDGNFVNLVATDDIVMRREAEYYILTSQDELVPFRKKNVIGLYLNKKTEIEKYLKSNKVNFNSLDDILRFSDWLSLFTNKI